MAPSSTLSQDASYKPFPETVLIIGAGVFGLSTALAVAKRHPSTEIIVVERLTPPVVDGSSVDTTRCIRSDYADPIYAQLARKSQTMIQNDPELSKHFYQCGMTFVCDGQPTRFTKAWEDFRVGAEACCGKENIIDFSTREEVYQRIHGQATSPLSADTLGRTPMWNKGYCNLDDGFIDAKAGIQIYYNRCLNTPSISFRCRSPVDHITVVDNQAVGVALEDGSMISANEIIVAAGAWSPKLVNLGKRLSPIGHEVAWIKVTKQEEQIWKNMSITTNDSTGLNMFPPYRGEIKILRRSPGYINTVAVPDPEDGSKQLQICYPRTIVTHPEDVIPSEAEAAMREDLREIMPTLANRPFDRTKICWISTTPTADFLIAPHPRIAGIHLATGGSAHAWKFLPVLGDLVVDSMCGRLPPDLAAKFAFHKFSGGKDENAPRMDGAPQEMRDLMRWSSQSVMV